MRVGYSEMPERPLSSPLLFQAVETTLTLNSVAVPLMLNFLPSLLTDENDCCPQMKVNNGGDTCCLEK